MQLVVPCALRREIWMSCIQEQLEDTWELNRH